MECAAFPKTLNLATLVLIATMLGGAAFGETVVDLRAAEQGGTTSETRAQRLVTAGEQLLFPRNFLFASEAFSRALKLNPNNVQAAFYVKALRPRVLMRGFMRRMEPLIGGLPESARSKMIGLGKGLVGGQFQDFLYDAEGGPVFRDEGDVRRLFTEVIEAVEDWRQFLKARATAEIELHLYYGVPTEALSRLDFQGTPSQSVFFAEGKRSAYFDHLAACGVKQDGPSRFLVSDCADLSLRSISIERADAEYLRLQAAVSVFMLLPVAAYRLDGLFGAANLKFELDGSHRDLVDYLKSIPEFGILERPEYLKAFRSMGTDAVLALRSFSELRSTLCPSGVPKNDIRPGRLITQGICASSGYPDIFQNRWKRNLPVVIPISRFLEMTDYVLSGGVVVRYEAVPNSNVLIKSRVNYSAPVVNPVKDIKTILPVEFNSCGNMVRFQDPTLGGFYVDGDANSVLESNGTLNRKCNGP